MKAATPATPTLHMLRIDRITPADDNIRADVGDVAELAASIKAVGVLEPIVVGWAPPNGDPGAVPIDTDTYTLVIGHRRLAAAKLAGNALIPAIIRQLTERERVEAMLIENLQREDLTPLEEAEAYRRLTDLGLGQVDLARRIGRSQAHVSKRLSLLKLPAEARAAINGGLLPLADALELVPYAAQPAVIHEAAVRVIDDLKRGGYRHPAGRIAAQVKQEVAEAEARKTALAGLEAAKVSILKTEERFGHRPTGNVTELGKGWGRLPMSPSAHKKHPCHAAYVDGRGVVHYVCTKPATHVKDPSKPIAKAAREITGAGRGDSKPGKAAQAKAAATRERNKVLRVAQPIRRKLAAQLLKPSKVRREALEFALRQLVQTALDHGGEVPHIAAELLGVKGRKDGFPSFAGVHVDTLAYALALAAGEAPFDRLNVRGVWNEEFSSHAARYFAHLKAANYKATPTELAQIKPSGWRPAFDGAGK